jgi:hypothetical protein
LVFTLISVFVVKLAFSAEASRRAKHPPKVEPKPRRKWAQEAAYVLVAVSYFAIFVVFYSAYVAERIRLGQGSKVTVDSASLHGVEMQLVGTTARFVVLYDPDTKVSHAISVEQLERLRFNLPNKPAPPADGK